MDILLGFRGADLDFDALEETLASADPETDTLTVALVVADADDPDGLESRVRDRLATAELETDLRRLEGEPGSELVAMAEREGFDRLVLAGGTRSPMGKIRMDATLEFVLLNATTTVTLVR